MTLQGKACCRWQCVEIQGLVCGAGFSWVEGVDYDETFASVARYTSIRSLISIAVEMGWKIH